jgi:DNA replicative helicase MCM subunit Mcm2 (Cdc46/Mcm family)
MMEAMHHTCDNCDSEFTVKYDEELVDDKPQFCPFCSELLIDFEKVEDDDE